MCVFRPVLQRFGSDIAHVLHVKAGGCGSSANQCTAHVWKWRHVLVNMKSPIVFSRLYKGLNNITKSKTKGSTTVTAYLYFETNKKITQLAEITDWITLPTVFAQFSKKKHLNMDSQVMHKSKKTFLFRLTILDDILLFCFLHIFLIVVKCKGTHTVQT